MSVSFSGNSHRILGSHRDEGRFAKSVCSYGSLISGPKDRCDSVKPEQERFLRELYWPNWNGQDSTVDTTGSAGWLRRFYRRLQGRLTKSDPTTTNSNLKKHTYKAINTHLYDNISFIDTPLNDVAKYLVADDSDQIADEKPHPSKGCIFGRFRIFLSIYALLGLTLAIYSRNVISLASVGMVASNELNRGLVGILSQSNNANKYFSGSHLDAPDGSCPIFDQLVGSEGDSPQVPSIDAPYQWTNHSEVISTRLQLEAKLRESIKQRVERGELVDWTPGEQGLIFASGCIGNLLLAIPLTRLGEIHGSKWIILAATLGATIQAAFMPLVCKYHFSLVVVFQVIFNGLTFGADCVAYTLFAYWLTPTEMAFFVSCLVICYQVGTIISGFFTAKILSLGLTWVWCFYLPAALCLMWSIIWMIIGASEPAKSWIISRHELEFISQSSKISRAISDDYNESNQSTCGNTDDPVSWRKLALDPNIWAIIAVKFSLRWYFSVYASLMPTYLSSVVHISVSTIGKMSVFQSLIGLISGVLMGYLTRALVTNRPYNLSLANVRKIFQSVVNFGLSLSLVALILYDCDLWIILASLTFGGICVNFYVAAALQLPLDLSPKNCGLISSITNTLAWGQALGAPISGLILNHGPKDRGLWHMVWLICILLNVFSGLIFIVLVDSKPKDYTKTPVEIFHRHVEKTSDVLRTSAIATKSDNGEDCEQGYCKNGAKKQQ